ncbi:hypothetical protein HanPI659440_Chr12g0461141 [Helianthus annuus]|nr:hypothetical protein HanPI659440_Chr12g0461141 [Helianthus annuus]
MFILTTNKTCEICGSIARNIAGADEVELIDQWNGPTGSTGTQATVPSETMATSEAHNLWQGHRFLNILLASMVFAFVISWLFHFNVPS